MNDVSSWALNEFSSEFTVTISGRTVLISNGSTNLSIKFVELKDIKLDSLECDSAHNNDGGLVLYSDEWQERRSQCEALIKARLHIFERRYGARECEIRQVDSKTAIDFTKTYHLQGSVNNAIVYFGLYLRDELLTVMALGGHHRNTNYLDRKVILLSRLCSKAGVQVIGGASKLFRAAASWAANGDKYLEMLSFSDNRWAEGKIYEELGFSIQRSVRSDYFYVKDGRRYSKQSQKKQRTNCPDGMTEYEWCTARGMIRLYDYGKKTWVFNLKPGEHRLWKDRLSEKTAQQHEQGFFHGLGITGKFFSNKCNKYIHYNSSYELRCCYMLENNINIIEFDRCCRFKGINGWREPDIKATYSDGSVEIIEIKPKERLSEEEVKLQLSDTAQYAKDINARFMVWTEEDSGLGDYDGIIRWAKEYLLSIGDEEIAKWIKISEEKKAIRRVKYQLEDKLNKIEFFCEFCNESHNVRQSGYNRNIKRNARYICEREGGKIAGSKPKPGLHVVNPHAGEGKKECSGCHDVKLLNEFDNRARSWDGKSSKCKECASKINKEKYNQKLLMAGKSIKSAEVKKQTGNWVADDGSSHGQIIDINCEYCHQTHSVRYKGYHANLKRNGRYVCQKEGQKIGRDNKWKNYAAAKLAVEVGKIGD